MSTPDKLMPILEFDELVEIFGYTNARSARRAMRLDKFPIPTFEIAGRTVAHVDVLKEYFDKKYDESIVALRDKYEPKS